MTIDISLEPIGDLESLEREWTALEARSDCTYYHSWAWAKAWLRHISDYVPVSSVVARREGTVVGLALVGESRRRWLVVGPRGLQFQGTRGRPGRISSEHGGFLVERGMEAEVRAAALRFLGDEVACGRWHFALVGWVPPDYVARRDLGRAVAIVRWTEPNYVIELDRVREVGDYPALLGSRTRANMRRSRRSYEREGPLRLRVAGSIEEANASFDRLIALHTKRWRARGWPGNFSDPLVVAFYRTLIDERFESGEIDVVRVTAGSNEVGYLFNFVYRDHVFSSDLGMHYDGDKDRQPGRMCDWLAIEHYASKGYAIYDNLEGETQFKRSSATSHDDLVWLLIRPNRFRDLAEERIRRAVIAKVRETALHRWQRRLRAAIASATWAGDDR